MRVFLRFLSTTFIALTLAACGGGGGSAGNTGGSNGTTPLTIVAPAAVTLNVGAAQSYTVAGGSGAYTVQSDNPAVLAATMEGSTVTVGALTSGTANIVVFDSRQNSAEVAFTILADQAAVLHTTAPSALIMGPGTSQSFAVRGGVKPYSVSSTNIAVASVSLSNSSTMVISAGSVGTANIRITDTAGTAVQVSVTVQLTSAPLAVNPSAATAIIGDTLFATISGGRAPYRAVVTNELVADASIVDGDTLQVDVQQQASSVPILILDADDRSVSFTLTSTPGDTSIRVAPTSLTVSERDNSDITLLVYGGVGTLTAFSSDPDLLEASVSGTTVTVSNGGANRCVLADTPVTITVLDSTNAIATSTITIADNVPGCSP